LTRTRSVAKHRADDSLERQSLEVGRNDCVELEEIEAGEVECGRERGEEPAGRWPVARRAMSAAIGEAAPPV
jgi:hypothetical protein